MDFGSRRKSLAKTTGDTLNKPDQLSLYKIPPSDAMSLDDFELHAIDRLRVMSAAENAQSRGDSIAEVNRKLEDALKTTHLELRTDEDSRRDTISHWVLRLAFAATEDLRRRFLAFEILLFKYRFEKKLDSKSVQDFMNKNNMGYKPISSQERDMYKESLRTVYSSRNAWRLKSGITSKPFESIQFFKVDFEEVPDLVSKRNVWVHQGFAYVPETDILSILASRFRQMLSLQLVNAYKVLPLIREDDRIRPVLSKLENAYLGPEFGTSTSYCGDASAPVTPDSIDARSKSFPMCMREMYRGLTVDHHLRYEGRLQFERFLKGVGLSMKDALTYFSREYCKKGISPDEFTKKYAYNIRHNYGQEGKRANYSAYSCSHIITGVQPGPNEYHGCPFKSFGAPQMKKVLTRQLGTSNTRAIDDICSKIANNEFQVACRMHFELEHPGADSGPVGNHPNAWYNESIQYFENKSNIADK